MAATLRARPASPSGGLPGDGRRPVDLVRRRGSASCAAASSWPSRPNSSRRRRRRSGRVARRRRPSLGGSLGTRVPVGRLRPRVSPRTPASRSRDGGAVGAGPIMVAPRVGLALVADDDLGLGPLLPLPRGRLVLGAGAASVSSEPAPRRWLSDRPVMLSSTTRCGRRSRLGGRDAWRRVDDLRLVAAPPSISASSSAVGGGM